MSRKVPHEKWVHKNSLEGFNKFFEKLWKGDLVEVIKRNEVNERMGGDGVNGAKGRL